MTEEGSPQAAIEEVEMWIELWKTGKISQADFFFFALGHYYSPISSGLEVNVGDLVYRLATTLSEVERTSIPIYPSEQGQILIDSILWLSLQDWYQEWQAFSIGSQLAVVSGETE